MPYKLYTRQSNNNRQSPSIKLTHPKQRSRIKQTFLSKLVGHKSYPNTQKLTTLIQKTKTGTTINIKLDHIGKTFRISFSRQSPSKSLTMAPLSARRTPRWNLQTKVRQSWKRASSSWLKLRLISSKHVLPWARLLFSKNNIHRSLLKKSTTAPATTSNTYKLLSKPKTISITTANRK